MASGSMSRSSAAWTVEQNDQFEAALALYDKDTPDRWQKVASQVGGKSAKDVERHYQQLLHDLHQIESGRISYSSTNANSSKGGTYNKGRMRYMNVQ